MTAGEEVATFYGPDNRGAISVDTPSLDKEPTVATVFIRALHIPRNVRHIRFQMTTLKEVDLELVSEKDGGTLSGWSLFGPDQQGFYDAFGPGVWTSGISGCCLRPPSLVSRRRPSRCQSAWTTPSTHQTRVCPDPESSTLDRG